MPDDRVDWPLGHSGMVSLRLRWRMRVIHPAKPVLVRRDGRWCDGDLRAWRRDLDGWLAFVLYGDQVPGVGWVAADRVRPGSGSHLD